MRNVDHETRRADSTRDRILTAAREIFARTGIAGARVDVIAREAHTSKERVYAYFRSKEALYAVVSAEEMSAIAAATQLDAANLPAYAGRVFDYFHEHPDSFRLVSWGRLEVTPGQHPDPEDPTHVSTLAKIDRIRQAQAEGLLDRRWDALDVLAIVNQIATAWMAQTEMLPVLGTQTRMDTMKARREAIIEAVSVLFPARLNG
jgi:AcrR family transcriptional regulator